LFFFLLKQRFILCVCVFLSACTFWLFAYSENSNIMHKYIRAQIIPSNAVLCIAATSTLYSFVCEFYNIDCLPTDAKYTISKTLSFILSHSFKRTVRMVNRVNQLIVCNLIYASKFETQTNIMMIP
jgi:hypothetical protein